MRHLTLSRWITVWMLAIALAPRTASAQAADTLSISGTFHVDALQGTVGAELAEVYANGNAHGWTLMLYGVTCSYDSYFYDWYDEWGYYGSDAGWITRVHATSFDFQFLGPDADVLNDVVSQQLVSGSLTDNALLELRNGDGYDARDPTGGGLYSSWDLGLSPLDASAGVTFNCIGDWMYGEFATDSSGYPALNPQRVGAYYSTITDLRPGYSGGLVSFGDLVDVGSAGPPVLPPTMSVAGFPSPATAGVAGNFTVTLRDPSGNVATGYTGTVRFTSSDAKATLPANYTFTAADAGIHSFSAMLKTAGTQSITAADTLTSALTATAGAITVNAAAASKFIMTAPSTVTAGVTFKLTLTVADAYDNAVTGYIGTVRFTSTDNRAKLPANYSFTAADKGVHTFVGLVLRRKGKQKITITDTRKSALTATVVENVH